MCSQKSSLNYSNNKAIQCIIKKAEQILFVGYLYFIARKQRISITDLVYDVANQVRPVQF